MPNKVKIRKRLRKAPKRKSEPDILERLKKLSDNAPVVQLHGGSIAFDKDIKTINFKDK